ncbi:MAG: hypothetical protein LC777_20585, partial [Actinobacteria bacterium]|nr:hypothetical protein [Actinomycetota bacterium]
VVTTTAAMAVGANTRYAAERAVLADLDGQCILGLARGGYRHANRVSIFGERYRYTAVLEGFELPPGWCVCRSGISECRCRDPRNPEKDVAVYLIGADPIASNDYRDIAQGEV